MNANHVCVDKVRNLALRIAQLGEYFGAKGGVLVIQAPHESAYKIKGGDVLLRVGKIRLTTPQHVLRVLKTQTPGLPIKIEVIRKGNRVELVAVAPTPAEDDVFVFPAPPDPPAPPPPPKKKKPRR